MNKRLSPNANGPYVLVGERNKLTNVKSIPQSWVTTSAMERNKAGKGTCHFEEVILSQRLDSNRGASCLGGRAF